MYIGYLVLFPQNLSNNKICIIETILHIIFMAPVI